MEIIKVLDFNSEEIQALVKFRANVFHPICDILEHRCELCPFNNACTNLDEFLDKVITDKMWFVPRKGE